jgi:hypothetical protein
MEKDNFTLLLKQLKRIADALEDIRDKMAIGCTIRKRNT